MRKTQSTTDVCCAITKPQTSSYERGKVYATPPNDERYILCRLPLHTSLLASRACVSCAGEACADKARGIVSDIFSGSPGNSSAAVPQSKNPSHLFGDATDFLLRWSVLAAIPICCSIRNNEITALTSLALLLYELYSSRRGSLQPMGENLHCCRATFLKQ